MSRFPEKQCEPDRKAGAQGFLLPLVSVVVVNHNYGRFLQEGIGSVFAQSYPSIECIIVDNASTDESADVLRNLAIKYPAIKILQREDNGGQSLALKEGFEASSGEYVVFLDADDILLPGFLETHIFVHLSLRVPVGFSSSDMIQAAGARMVTGTVSYLSEFAQSGRGRRPGLMRRIDASAPSVWPLQSPGAAIETEVHFVDPCETGGWMWAPTSGNCFRRDALQLFLNNDNLAALRSCTDSYLLRGVNLITGSVVIDRPLGIYRLHGMNVFSKHPHLNGVLSFDKSSPSDNNQLGQKLIMDHMIAKAPVFLQKMPSAWHYVKALKALEETWPKIPSVAPGCRSYLAERIAAEPSVLLPALGYFNFVSLLLRFRTSPRVILKACFGRSKKMKKDEG